VKANLSWVFVALVAFVLGFFSGSRIGVSEFLKADAQYKASILAHQIIGLKGPRRDDILEAMEISLNGELANHGKYMESYWTWLRYELHRTNEPIEFAANYRKNNPYEAPDVSDPSKWQNTEDYSPETLEQFANQLREGQTEGRRLINLVLDRYAR
jgi:hypothetical protein